jgi:hypothetical protein
MIRVIVEAVKSTKTVTEKTNKSGIKQFTVN